MHDAHEVEGSNPPAPTVLTRTFTSSGSIPGAGKGAMGRGLAIRLAIRLANGRGFVAQDCAHPFGRSRNNGPDSMSVVLVQGARIVPE
jgi:hypothetical protein